MADNRVITEQRKGNNEMTDINHTDLCDDGTGYDPDCTCDTDATVTYTAPDGFVHPDKVCPFCFDQLTAFDARRAAGFVVA